MFNAPAIIESIPDIGQIYQINESQCDDLDRAIERLDDNLFISTIDGATAARWERMLDITLQENDSLENRRFRIRAKIMEKTQYTYRSMIRLLDMLCGADNYILTMDGFRLECQLYAVDRMEDVERMLETILPLNIYFHVTAGVPMVSENHAISVLQEDEVININQVVI